MANIDINSLFSDILPSPAQQQRERVLQQNEAVNQANLVGTLGGMAAYLAPQRSAALGQAARGLFGMDTRSEADKLREAMQGVDPNNPQDLIRLASMADAVDPAKGIQLRQAAAQITAQQRTQQEQARVLTQQRNAMTDTVSAIEDLDPAIQNAAFSAIEAGTYDGNIEALLESVAPNKDRYNVQNGAVWDNLKGEWKVSPTEEAKDTGLGFSSIDPDQYTPESVTAYRLALRDATTEEERITAGRNLKLKRADNWEYKPVKDSEGNEVLDEYGIPKMVAFPTGKDYSELKQKVRSANAQGEIVLEKTGDILQTMDRVEDALSGADGGKPVDTGFGGKVLSYFPATEQYTLSGDVDTVLANLGYTALQDARRASDNGSSGYGQLTERELLDLKSLVESLNIGMKKKDFEERFAAIRSSFERARKKAQTGWTVEQWIGLEEPPKSSLDIEDPAVQRTGTGLTYREVK
jgi:hypothetical protein